jgi:hypothetical protein
MRVQIVRRYSVLCLLILSQFASPAWAEKPKGLVLCQTESGDDGIQACTSFINAPGAATRDLAVAYGVRSFHYERANQFEKALADTN